MAVRAGVGASVGGSSARRPGDGSVTAMVFQQIPMVSLADWIGPDADRDAFARHLCDVCHEVGFLQLVDHGVDPVFIDEYFDALEAFFALPEPVKAKIDKSDSPWFRGWERVGTERTDAQMDHREQFDVWTAHDPVDVGDGPAYLRLLGPNQWPDETDLPGFRGLVERFHDEMATLADALMAAMSVGLGLGHDHLAERFGTERVSLMKLIHYPPTPTDAAGVNAHHDTGFLTLLWQHRVGGLQVRNQRGDWIDVPVDDRAVIVNIGETLQSMTGNYFVATDHRVISPVERYSSAYFHGPELATDLSPLPLAASFADAVAASPHHRGAGFMASHEELEAGARGTSSQLAGIYGDQLWNYVTRSYPQLVARHHPDLV